jgi:hypothetical protein
MDHDSPVSVCTTFTYEDGRLVAITDSTGRYEKLDEPVDPMLVPRGSFTLAHDVAKRVLMLTGPDGKTEVFRDKPTRYLSVAPDPESGEMKPVMKYGRPVYLWLCREEHEVH